MYKKNNKTLLAIFTISIMALILRFYYLQIFDGKILYKSASIQRTANLPIEKVRGDILDKNLIPFTNRITKTSIILKPFFLKEHDEDIKKVCDILNINFTTLKREIEIKKEPILIKITENEKTLLDALNLEAITFLNSTERYTKNSSAKHVIGYIGKTDETGLSGIEKKFERYLKTNDENIIGAVVDARNNLLPGVGYRILEENNVNPKKLSVKLTIDYNIQQIVETVMQNNNITGAVVIKDIKSGDITAMASKPDFDQNDIGNYLTGKNNELLNRCTASYNLGSIFKIVDAAELLESGTQINNNYFCNGRIKVGNLEFKCSSHPTGGHGTVDFEKAFAFSCNPYFIDMGLKLGCGRILNMASKLGLGSGTGIDKQGIDESSGNISPTKDMLTSGDVANISIGQGDIMATPVQVANLVAIVANNGIKTDTNIVDSIVDEDGNTIEVLRQTQSKKVLSDSTCEKLKSLMEKVTIFGTGTKANIDALGGAAGKTGSAETGQYLGGEKVVQAWFAGYFPCKNPKYAVSILVENGKSGGGVAAPIFRLIAEEIIKKYYYRP